MDDHYGNSQPTDTCLTRAAGFILLFLTSESLTQYLTESFARSGATCTEVTALSQTIRSLTFKAGYLNIIIQGDTKRTLSNFDPDRAVQLLREYSGEFLTVADAMLVLNGSASFHQQEVLSPAEHEAIVSVHKRNADLYIFSLASEDIDSYGARLQRRTAILTINRWLTHANGQYIHPVNFR